MSKPFLFALLPFFCIGQTSQLEKLSWARLGDGGTLFAVCYVPNDSVFSIAGGSAFNISAINTSKSGCQCDVISDRGEFVFRCQFTSKTSINGTCSGDCAQSFARKNQFFFRQK